MRLWCGPDWETEDRTTALLMADRKARGAYSGGRNVAHEEFPWLSPNQYEARLRYEVFCAAGHPDPEIIVGMFWRCYNPLAGTHRLPKPDG